MKDVSSLYQLIRENPLIFAAVLKDCGYFELSVDKFRAVNMMIVGTIYRYMAQPIDQAQFIKLAECLIDRV